MNEPEMNVNYGTVDESIHITSNQEAIQEINRIGNNYPYTVNECYRVGEALTFGIRALQDVDKKDQTIKALKNHSSKLITELSEHARRYDACINKMFEEIQSLQEKSESDSESDLAYRKSLTLIAKYRDWRNWQY